MTLEEFKIAVAESPNKDWLDSQVLNIDFPYLKTKTQIKGAVPIYNFINQNVEGFSEYSNLPRDLKDVKNHFIQAKNGLVNCLSNKNFQQYEFTNCLSVISSNGYRIFPYDAPETKFLIHVFNTDPIAYNGAYEYIVNGTSNATNKDYFKGYLIAYEFLSSDSSEILKRKKIEEETFDQLRDKVHKQVAESQEAAKNYMALAYENLKEYSTKIDTLKTDKENLFTTWYKESSNTFKSFHEASQIKIKDLEDLYEKKLKLEAPAQYWNKRASTLKAEGQKWLIWLSVCIGIGVAVLIAVLNLTADGTLKEIFKEVGTAVKWSVALITLISFLAFGIRTFAKLMFSAFHLSRDAEEREQLTYVYLSLQKGKAIDSTERHMIMQSLFSRADSGLLKDDSGPTMPGSFMDQIGKAGK